MIQRNKKSNNKSRQKLYHTMLVTYCLLQKELDADSKAIQQIEFVGQLKNLNGAIAAGEVMFFLKISQLSKF